jgi:hypothetical protein
MLKACVLAVLAAVFSGCTAPTRTWKGELQWPDPHDTPLVAPSMEAGAALAAAAAIREMVKTNKDPGLFWGCSSPEQGLNVSVFKDPKTGLYFVVLEQRFNRCGGPSGRVLDWWYEYAVTAQGEVVAEAPPMQGEAPLPRKPNITPGEQPPPPATPTPNTEGETPAPTLPPAESPQPLPEAPGLTPPPSPGAGPGAATAGHP